MNRFFVKPEQISDKKIILEGTDVNHIKNVLRLQENDKIIICDGQGREFDCIIVNINCNNIITEIISMKESNSELKSKVILFQGMPKKDKMELIIQKAVELGVYEIIPVITKRTIVKLDKKKEKNKLARWNKISESAAKQARRGIIPKVKEPLTIQRAFEVASEFDLVIIPYELANNMKHTKEIISELNANTTKTIRKIGIFIGPEGGFDDTEIEEALKRGYLTITLGKRILRTETAGLTILSIIMYNLEEA